MLRSSRIPGTLVEFSGTGVHSVPADALLTLNAHAITAVANLANKQDGRRPIRASDWRMMFLCLVSASSLREALNRAADFYEMLEDRWGRLTLRTQDGVAELRFDSMRTARNRLALAADTVGIAALHGLLSWLIGQTIPLELLLLEYDPSLRPECLYDRLPFPARMGADRTAIRFGAEYLDYPVIRTGQDRGDRLILSFSLELDDAATANLAERARRVMYQSLRSCRRVPSLRDLSDSLQQNRATLRRQLKQAGVSYNQLKDSCRREVALDLLRRSALSVEGIADQLGFCDSDAFRRAFRAWMGMSPSEYRRTCEIRSAPGAPPRA